MKSLFIILLFSSFVQAATILIDPGHGGEDLGAKSSIWKNQKMSVVFEKDIALELSKLIQKELKALGYSVYLTRSYDRAVSLHERSHMADKVRADLFISVHANSSGSADSNGVETYYLDNHKDKAIKKIEDIENKETKGKEAIVNQILIDLAVQKTAPLSKRLAEAVHLHVKRKILRKYKIKDRGVKPGLFYVLALSKRPSILLEVGFLSHQKERQKIMNKTYQKEYAKAVALGVEKFLGKKSKKESLPLF